MDYPLIKLTAGVIAILGLYSVLYRENKFYRFWEHVFLGLASGYSLLFIWKEVLKSQWYDRMVGSVADSQGSTALMGYPLYAILIPIGLMGYFVFSKKHNWISKIPIGIILGLYSGQQFQAWGNRYLPQISGSMKPIFPTTFASFIKPDTTGLSKVATAQINAESIPRKPLRTLFSW